MIIEWLAGVTTIRHEQRIEEDAMVFGAYVNEEWRETCRMSFNGDQEIRRLALRALADVNQRKAEK